MKHEVPLRHLSCLSKVSLIYRFYLAAMMIGRMQVILWKPELQMDLEYESCGLQILSNVLDLTGFDK